MPATKPWVSNPSKQAASTTYIDAFVVIKGFGQVQHSAGVEGAIPVPWNVADLNQRQNRRCRSVAEQPNLRTTEPVQSEETFKIITSTLSPALPSTKPGFQKPQLHALNPSRAGDPSTLLGSCSSLAWANPQHPTSARVTPGAWRELPLGAGTEETLLLSRSRGLSLVQPLQINSLEMCLHSQCPSRQEKQASAWR